MSIGGIDEFLDFMPDTVTVYSWTGQSVSAVPTYSSTGNTYPCRVEMKNHRVVDSNGREVLARGRVILGSSAVVDARDKIVLPSDYVPVSPPIIAINIIPDEGGGHHTTLEIG